MKKILVVVGARPNFVKVARLKAIAMERSPDLRIELVHTGQHSAAEMTHVFFEQFGTRPDHFLRIAESTPVARLGQMLIGLDRCMSELKPDLVMVVGDVDSTLAGALAASRNGIRLAHLESGLRSFDRSMPEEVNRILVDRIADLHFVTEESGRLNLLREGIAAEKIHLVGNTMIDALVAFADAIEGSPILQELGLDGGGHILVTMHRPATVDRREGLEKMLEVLETLSAGTTVIHPMHPRTRRQLENFGLFDRLASNRRIRTIAPLDHFSFQKLLSTSSCVITDSGGVQEETTFRQVPCITLRANTERPVTVTEGTNRLLPLDPEAIAEAIGRIRDGLWPKGTIPQLWDGHATERVLEVLRRVI